MDTKEQLPLGKLFGDLARDIVTVIQQEARLARAEMTGKVTGVARPVGFIAAGGALLYAGLLAILAAAVIGLHALLPWWTAALLVGLVVIAGGYLLVQTGLEQVRRQDVVPRETIASLASFRRLPRT
ncbi:MAG TPA: phage holin family protein [Candidatus Dormibacteraeota bacterium]|jgi:hypothetical protein